MILYLRLLCITWSWDFSCSMIMGTWLTACRATEGNGRAEVRQRICINRQRAWARIVAVYACPVCSKYKEVKLTYWLPVHAFSIGLVSNFKAALATFLMLLEIVYIIQNQFYPPPWSLWWSADFITIGVWRAITRKLSNGYLLYSVQYPWRIMQPGSHKAYHVEV